MREGEGGPTSTAPSVGLRLWRLARRAALWAGTRLGPKLHFELVSEPIYSPIPQVPPAGDAIWDRRASMAGVPTATEEQLALLESLAPYLAEFTTEVSGRGRFPLWNGYYQAGDAETLYALLRHLRPARVLEIGSGWSTLVSAAACAANARDGSPTELVAVDPSPRVEDLEGSDGFVRLERCDCRELSPSRFETLEAGDVLFLDTSHVVKLGSEVNWLVLEVLPSLRPGVWVHIHDVFLPYEYQRYLFEHRVYFNEQYLVHAFLTGNPDWEVALPLCALYREQPEQVARLIPSLAEQPPDARRIGYVPAAFWIRRTG